MADLGHTPRRYELEDGEVGNPIKYLVKWWSPGFFAHGMEDPLAIGHVCTECGCFYVPIEGQVCPNKVMEILKERVL